MVRFREQGRVCPASCPWLLLMMELLGMELVSTFSFSYSFCRQEWMVCVGWCVCGCARLPPFLFDLHVQILFLLLLFSTRPFFSSPFFTKREKGGPLSTSLSCLFDICIGAGSDPRARRDDGGGGGKGIVNELVLNPLSSSTTSTGCRRWSHLFFWWEGGN